MKFCSKCGAELVDDAVICTKCGCFINEAPAPAPKVQRRNPEASSQVENESGNSAIITLSFITSILTIVALFFRFDYSFVYTLFLKDIITDYDVLNAIGFLIPFSAFVLSTITFIFTLVKSGEKKQILNGYLSLIFTFLLFLPILYYTVK